MGLKRGCPGKGRVLKQTSAEACGNCGLCCGLDEAISQDNTGKYVLGVRGLGAFCGFCCLPSVVVRGGILEHLLSLLETHKQYGYCSEAEELLGGASRRDRACLTPQGGMASSASERSPTCPVKRRLAYSPQPLL